ncbi:peptidase U35, phage prohead HK97 [Salinisphaera shabanensis T35B1]|uniref:HK97 family phage prohead protease n=1 Tax=Salinisphaera shabanensis TaxID=180542 RepID=UPI00333E3DB5
MLEAATEGELTVRAKNDGTRVIGGRFPYGKTATLSDGGRKGRPRKERFKPRAFSYRVELPTEDIHLLVGHSYDKPLASKLNKTLTLTDSDDALTFEAEIAPDVADTSYGKDILALIASGLVVGLSPGFRIPPERAVQEAETVEEEDPAEGLAIIRTINEALLYELSIVTRPAYKESQVEARSWQPPSNYAAHMIRAMAYR